MPTWRRRAPRIGALMLGEASALHLVSGDCLLPGPGENCACGLRSTSGAEALEAWQTLWAQDREAVLRLGRWRHPFACLSAVLFDRASLPDQPGAGWTTDDVRTWEHLRAEAARIKGQR